MGKFTDTKYTNTVNKLIDASKSKLDNPYYIFSDQKPTKVTYYAQNIEKSTLDESSGLYEAHVGDKSPFKFNKIKDFLIYGIERISTEYDVGDYGTEANQISGDGLILPNTINPRPGDFFSIDYVKESILFKVNGVTTDTLDTGANFYKIEYAAELTGSIDKINEQVEKEFNFIPKNVGTDFKAVLQSCDYDLIENLEELVEKLIVFFENIFFDTKLQTFCYNHDGWYMYDPFMIEFLIRNSILDYGNEYVYVSHATEVDKTFSMDYYRTFFYCLENPKTANVLECCNNATADLITDPNSLFITRLYNYYRIRYFDKTPYKTRFSVFDTDVLEHINSNTMYDTGDEKECYNLWIAYFNDNDDFLKGDILSLLNKTDYMDNMDCFYMLGISIYIIETYIKHLLS